jgi:hypothetical protein
VTRRRSAAPGEECPQRGCTAVVEQAGNGNGARGPVLLVECPACLWADIVDAPEVPTIPLFDVEAFT